MSKHKSESDMVVDDYGCGGLMSGVSMTDVSNPSASEILAAVVCFDPDKLRAVATIETDTINLPPLTVHDDNDPITTTKVMARFGSFLGVAYRYPDHEDLSDDELRDLAMKDLSEEVRTFVKVLVDHGIVI